MGKACDTCSVQATAIPTHNIIRLPLTRFDVSTLVARFAAAVHVDQVHFLNIVFLVASCYC